MLLYNEKLQIALALNRWQDSLFPVISSDSKGIQTRISQSSYVAQMEKQAVYTVTCGRTRRK
jgi:hypothetical protein